MYFLHKSGEVCTQFQEKTAIHFILLYLVQPTSVTVQQGTYAYLGSEGHLVLPLSVAKFE